MTRYIWLFSVILLPMFGFSQFVEARYDSSSVLASIHTAELVQKDGLKEDTLRFYCGNQVTIDSVINFSKKFIGTPYRYGGRTTAGFDCSGFMIFVFKSFGINLPPSSRPQAMVGEKVSRDSIQMGDLVFFKGRSSKSKSIGHVGLVVAVSDTNDVQFIHSTRHGLRLDWISTEPYYKNRFMASRRIITDQPK